MSLYKLKAKRHVLEVPLYLYELRRFGQWNGTLFMKDLLSPTVFNGDLEACKTVRIFNGKEFNFFVSCYNDLRNVLESHKDKNNYYIKELSKVYGRMKVMISDSKEATVALPTVTRRCKAFQVYKRDTMNIEEFWGKYLDV